MFDVSKVYKTTSYKLKLKFSNVCTFRLLDMLLL